MPRSGLGLVGRIRSFCRFLSCLSFELIGRFLRTFVLNFTSYAFELRRETLACRFAEEYWTHLLDPNFNSGPVSFTLSS